MQKGPRHHEGPFAYFSLAYFSLAYFSLAWNSSLWIFCDEDLIRSSNRRNSAVSSAIDLGGGLGGKGITSDMARTSLGFIPRCPLLMRNCRVSAAQVFTRARNAP